MPYVRCTRSAHIRRHWTGAAVCILLALSGCATNGPTTSYEALDPALLTGERIFGEPISPEELPDIDISSPSDAMLEYVAETVNARSTASSRFRHLFDSLARDGYFDSVYSADQTLTAAETFEARGGNCLSYTNMFLALARAAGLDARYQIVEVPPSWDADAGFLIRYTHVNVLMKRVRLDHTWGQEVIVDFNIVQPDPDYRRREVDDEYAESLFYANESVNLMRAGRHREAFAHLRRAIDLAPQNPDLWINLGAFYATQHDFDAAIQAYEAALQIEPRNKSAFSGLARSYHNLGDREMAALYERKVRYYRERNPYYHYALAQAAYASADFETSLDNINTAIQLKRRAPRFHFLKGLVEHRLGEVDAARDSMERAERYGLHQSVKADLLRTLVGVNSS